MKIPISLLLQNRKRTDL